MVVGSLVPVATDNGRVALVATENGVGNGLFPYAMARAPSLREGRACRDQKQRGGISPERSEPRKRSQEGCAVWCFSPMRWRGRHRHGRVELPLDRKRRGASGRAGARPSRTRRGSGRVALVATDGTRGYTRSTGGSSFRSTGNGVGNACAELRELAVRRGFPEIAVVEHPA